MPLRRWSVIALAVAPVVALGLITVILALRTAPVASPMAEAIRLTQPI